MFSYTRLSRNLVRVDWDGIFAGHLSRSTYKPSGLHAKRHDVWEGTICEAAIRAHTLTDAKRKIADCRVEYVHESRYDETDRPRW